MTTALKLRLRFAKRDDLRLISHHDLMRCLERMIRRARIPVARSQGFTPRPRITFALALGLGLEGHDEIVDIELSEPQSPADVLSRLTEQAPAGLHWLGGETLAAPAKAPRPVALVYELQVPFEHQAQVRRQIDLLLSSAHWPLVRHRPDRETDRTIDLRPFVLDAELSFGGVLRARLKVLPEGSARPEELLESLGIRNLLKQGAVLARTRLELAEDHRTVPTDQGE